MQRLLGNLDKLMANRFYDHQPGSTKEALLTGVSNAVHLLKDIGLSLRDTHQDFSSPAGPTQDPVEMMSAISTRIPKVVTKHLHLQKKVESAERNSPAAKDDQRRLTGEKDVELGIETNKVSELQRELHDTKEKLELIGTQHRSKTQLVQTRDEKVAELEKQLLKVKAGRDQAKKEAIERDGAIGLRERGIQDLEIQLADMKQPRGSAEIKH
ncbi:MAG: hypothetical protein Q9184_005355 [Pyrenodesmia sp. 2 TL-2023]